MGAKIELTDHQKKVMREHYGKIPNAALAERVGISTTTLREKAKLMGLKSERKMPPEWTKEEFEQLQRAIAAGMSNREMENKIFPHRSLEGIKQFRRNMRRRGWKFEVLVKPESKPRNQIAPHKRAPVDFTPKEPPKFPPLEYTLDECPRVTLDYACQWMRQQIKGWEQPEDDKEAWRAINAQRLFGPIPVPPFLPDRRPAHNDNHKVAPLVLPEWRVGAR